MRDDEIVTVTIDICGIRHVLVAHVRVSGNTLAECWVSRTSDSLDTGNEIDIITLRDIEWKPGELSWADVDFRIERKEA